MVCTIPEKLHKKNSQVALKNARRTTEVDKRLKIFIEGVEVEYTYVSSFHTELVEYMTTGILNPQWHRGFRG